MVTGECSLGVGRSEREGNGSGGSDGELMPRCADLFTFVAAVPEGRGDSHQAEAARKPTTQEQIGILLSTPV